MRVAQTPEDEALLDSAIAFLDRERARRANPPPPPLHETLGWRKALRDGIERGRQRRELARIKALVSKPVLYEERTRRIREWQELAVYWDGPGSEGRCV